MAKVRQTAREPSQFDLEQMMTTLISARARLLAEDPNIERDEVLYHDMIEGESGDVLDVLDETMRTVVGYEDMVQMAERRIEIIQERARRWQERAERLRGIVHAVFEAGGMTRRDLPDLVASIAEGRDHVEITNETAIPDQYIETKRVPMKGPIGAELRAGRKVPGATLSNKMPRLQIRTR